MILPARQSLTNKAAGIVGRTALAFSPSGVKPRLLSTLAILEQRDGILSHGSLSAFTAARALGGTVHGFVAGTNATKAAEAAANVDGVEKIIVINNDVYNKVSTLQLQHELMIPRLI